ncbi:hypothetical protein V8C86DRAFT_2826916 [Haematococcus lacustris]
MEGGRVLRAARPWPWQGGTAWAAAGPGRRSRPRCPSPPAALAGRPLIRPLQAALQASRTGAAAGQALTLLRAVGRQQQLMRPSRPLPALTQQAPGGQPGAAAGGQLQQLGGEGCGARGGRGPRPAASQQGPCGLEGGAAGCLGSTHPRQGQGERPGVGPDPCRQQAGAGSGSRAGSRVGSGAGSGAGSGVRSEGMGGVSRLAWGAG